MTLATWKKEFYPIPADKVSKAKALAHSLRKWEGLTAENLERHGLTNDCGSVCEENRPERELTIAAESCALCHWHLDEVSHCQTCPLVAVRGCRCDYTLKYGDISPYRAFVGRDNPQPMIELLRAAKERAK